MNQPDKAELKSLDVAGDKRRQLAQMFPEAVTETLRPDGSLAHAVDFEKLKAVLGAVSDLLENQKERYGMSWPGKNDCLKVIQQPSIATLKPCREESVNFDTTENLFIEGDNLEVLKLLQKAYYGKVKMIYIDPPYNTGKEFIYPDNYSENLDTYLAYTGQVDAEGRKFATNTEAEGRFHSKWLNMMLPRLYLARNLLREDGVLFVSIGQGELSNLTALCRDIFGESNFIGVIGRAMKSGGNSGKFFSPNLDFIVVCTKSSEDAAGFRDEMSNELAETVYTKVQQEGPRKGERYRTMGLYQSSLSLDRSRHARYYIDCPDGSRCIPPENKRWRVIESSYKEMVAIDDIEFCETPTSPLFDDSGKPSKWNVYTKIWLKDRQEEGRVPVDLIIKYENRHSAKELLDLDIPFDFPKPSGLIKYLAEISQTQSGDIILDFFSGSCTTAHAVLDLNKQDGGARKFIMVQLSEPCDEKSEAYKAGYRTIAEIGKERIRRVIEKLNGEDQGKLDLSDGKKPDRGFRVYKLDRSNFKVWDSERAAQEPGAIAKQLELHELHVDPKAAQEDILYELLLKSGFPLATPVEKVRMAGKDVFSVSGGTLLICLERDITKELIKAMAAAAPAQVICLDEGFKANDQLKANAVQTFKARGKGKESETIFRTV